MKLYTIGFTQKSAETFFSLIKKNNVELLIDGDTYDKQYNKLLEERGDYKKFLEKFSSYENICLLCSEATAEKCHRRLMAELIKKANPKIEIIHI